MPPAEYLACLIRLPVCGRRLAIVTDVGIRTLMVQVSLPAAETLLYRSALVQCASGPPRDATFVTNSLSLLVNPMAHSTPNGGDPVQKLLVGSHDAQCACAH